MYKIGSFTIFGRTKIFKNFLLNSKFKSSPLVILLFIIKGACKISSSNFSYTINQKIDYSVLGKQNANSNQHNKYVSYYNSLSNVDQAFTKNQNLYKFIIAEICTIFYYFHEKNGVVCLLHCYRVLEKIAFTLPLIYSRRTIEYSKFFNQMKKYFLNLDTQSGELVFLKSVLSNLLDSNILSFLFSFKLSSNEIKALSVCLQKYNSAAHLTQIGSNIYELNLTPLEFIDFFIDLRNKYFHALSGKDHISLVQLIAPEKTFLIFIPDFVNLICYLIVNFMEPDSVTI